jgi:hypothetical protein
VLTRVARIVGQPVGIESMATTRHPLEPRDAIVLLPGRDLSELPREPRTTVAPSRVSRKHVHPRARGELCDGRHRRPKRVRLL